MKIKSGEVSFGKKKWSFASLHDIHLAANTLLRQAILNERYKRWRKVIESYLELLWLINIEHFPDDYEAPSSYSMLLYELHFHLGVAYQHVGKHQKAVEHFSKTIEVVSIAKNGCLAGCLTNSCLMTPIYARRAFAYSKMDCYKLSLKDAEKAVVLDSTSPDVYCIRALVRSTFDDELYGLKDLEAALKFDPDHVCATMLKASFTKPLFTSAEPSRAQILYEDLRQKAIRLCHDVETYLTCNSFSHPCIVEFYDKFLFPLSVPHTITSINLTPEKPSKKHVENDAKHKVSQTTRPTSVVGPPSGTGQASVIAESCTANPVSTEVFRCGTPSVVECNRMPLKRRTDYGNAIRKFMARPASAAEYFNLLEKQRRRETQIKRAQTALIRPGERFARLQTPLSSPFSTFESLFPDHSTPKPKAEVTIEKPTKAPTSKKLIIETPSNYDIPVFQAVNIKRAPRMYYRPWDGDKLPAAERHTFKYTPAFY